MSWFRKYSLLVRLAAILCALTAQPASATQFVLGAGNPDLLAYAGPYATLDVVRTGDFTADITFTALDSPGGGYHFLIGNGGSVALNVNGPVTYGDVRDITQPQVCGGPGCRPPSFTVASGQVDGWGTFNFVLNNYDGFRNAFRTLTFTLTLTEEAGVTWASDADVLTENSLGNSAAAHIFVANADWTNTRVTGFATVPDGGMTVTLLGLALAGMGLLARRVK